MEKKKLSDRFPRPWLGIVVLGIMTYISSFSEAAGTLVYRGNPSSAIILAEKPTRSARLAAAELREHIRLITGAEIPILSENDNPPEGVVHIYVGESQATREIGLRNDMFAPQESLIRITDKEIILIGRDDLDFGPISYEKNGAWPGFNISAPFYRLGALYAVYDFLEQFCGVRWYMVTDLGRVVPEKKTLKFKPVERRRRPWTSYRMIGREYWSTPGDIRRRTEDTLVARYAHLASGRDNMLYALRSRRGGEPYAANHSVYGYYKRFAQKHPDWWVDGVPGRHKQLRYNHPEVVAQVVKDAKEFFNKPFSVRRRGVKGFVGAGDYFAAVPLDNRNYGTGCEPPLQPERQGRGFGSGVASDYIFTWVNRVAKEVCREYPDQWISTIAYAGMFEPPGFDIEPNIAVTVCMANGWEEDGYGMEILRRWGRKVSHLYTWEYHYPFTKFPKVQPHKAAGYIRRLQAMGIQGMFMEMGHMNSALYHLDCYVINRMLINKEADADKILAEYFRLFYGPAERPVRDFWQTLEEARREEKGIYQAAKGGERFKDWTILASEKRMVSLEQDIRSAEQLAGEEPYASRVKMLRTGILAYLKTWRGKYEKIIAAKTPVLTARKTYLKPVLDGKLNDALWEDCIPTSPFVTLQNNPVEVKTTGMVAYDNENLYIGFWCEELDMTSQVLIQKTFNSGICTDDSVEFVIDVGRRMKDYLHVMMNANGVMWYQWPKKYAQNELPDMGIGHKAYRGQKEWTAEFVVPLKKITEVLPKAGDTWGLNLMRNRYPVKKWKYEERGGNIWRAWSPTFVAEYHVIDRFGLLRFEEQAMGGGR